MIKPGLSVCNFVPGDMFRLSYFRGGVYDSDWFSACIVECRGNKITLYGCHAQPAVSRVINGTDGNLNNAAAFTVKVRPEIRLKFRTGCFMPPA